MTDSTHPIGVPEQGTSGDGLTIECYLRPDVSRASLRQIKAIQERLQELAETPLVNDVEVKRWPAKHDANIEIDGSASDREERVSEFEAWAERNGCTLRPAFQRRHVTSSVLGPDEPREEICVPTVTLVMYDDGTDDTEPRGVVPYTIEKGTEIERIYTVDDWLSAAEQAAMTATGSTSSQPGTGTQTRGK